MSCSPHPYLFFVNIAAGATLEVWVEGDPNEYLVQGQVVSGGNPAVVPADQLWAPSRFRTPVGAAVTVFARCTVTAGAQCTVRARVVSGGGAEMFSDCYVVSSAYAISFPVSVIAST